ncbi:MAG: endonuclease/exonuclease/phosphatase family protein [Gammaproteobacteria bacterium]|nr:endonuclease/exonuclease/phosphatase family protein [Gammaproteobacteria bacterium]
MTRSTVLLTVTLLAGLAAASNWRSNPSQGIAPDRLRIATWNLEWLIAPEEFRALARDCVPRDASPGPRRRTLPCDTAARLERSTADFRALERYARLLDADVIALQEVDGERAARLVFPDHEFCFTQREGVQNNGFALRRGLAHRCGEDWSSLSLNGRVRSGAELILFPGTAQEIRLLSVHLKSGCPRRPLDDPRDACETLAKQVPELERWIDTQAAAGRRYAILGDFNHDLLMARGPARNDQGQLRNLWAEIDDGEPAGARLVNVAAGQPFVNCSAGQNYTSYIDHVVLGESLAEWRLPGSFIRLTYDTRDALQRKLSDHCPVGVDLAPPRAGTPASRAQP